MGIVFWAGDSTVKRNTILTYPQTGIAQAMEWYLKPGVTVENHAENGRSTKSFIDEGRLAAIYDRIREGDFLFIQFGHNDEKIADPARYADVDGEFPANLERFVNAARNRGALPVLITPLARRRYGEITEETHATYAEAVRRTAARLAVPLIDLYEASTEAIRQKGEGSAEWFLHVPPGKYPHFPQGLADDTHLCCAGAVAFAGLVARGLFALGGPYAALLLAEYAQTLNEA